MNFASWGPATILVVAAALIIIAIGGISVITGDLEYEVYLRNLAEFAKGVGLLAIGRGIYKRGVPANGESQKLKDR